MQSDCTFSRTSASVCLFDRRDRSMTPPFSHDRRNCVCNEWVPFKAAQHAVYLGLQLGLAAAAHTWEDAIQKLRESVLPFTQRPMLVAVLAAQYRARCLSLLSHLGALAPHPHALERAERDIVAKLLRMPGRPWSAHAHVEMALRWNCPDSPSWMGNLARAHGGESEGQRSDSDKAVRAAGQIGCVGRETHRTMAERRERRCQVGRDCDCEASGGGSAGEAE